MIQPHLPVRLPCYDFTPLAGRTFDTGPLAVGLAASGAPDSDGVTGGVYKARERIHRAMLMRDYSRFQLRGAGLQAPVRTGTGFLRSAHPSRLASLCTCHCSTCVAQDIRAVMT